MYFERKAKRACQSSLTFYLVFILIQSLKFIPCILSPFLNILTPNLVSGIPGTSIIKLPLNLAPILHTILPNNFFICKHFLSLKSVLKSRTKKLRVLDFSKTPALSITYWLLFLYVFFDRLCQHVLEYILAIRFDLESNLIAAYFLKHCFNEWFFNLRVHGFLKT